MSDALPLSIQNNRRMEKWVRFQPDRTVRLAVGKVEIGQSVLIALTQIAAEELDIAIDRFVVVSGDTAEAPDEGSTSSSQSIEMSGRSVRLITAELRARIVDRLARRLNCSPSDISVEDGEFLLAGEPAGHDYWNFAAAEDFAAEIGGTAPTKDPSRYRIVGQPVPRRDLAAKIGGAAFIHDMVRPDMLHARILRQPSRTATPRSFDEAAVRRAAGGDFQVVRIGNFIAFVGVDETTVQRAAMAAPAHAVWDNVRQLTPAHQEASWYVGKPSDDRFVGDPVPAAMEGEVVTATYSRPFVAHAAIAPSCGLAEFRDGTLNVWSHTQGVYPLRNSLASILGLPRERVIVHHAHGAGCYGHNGADDAAADAAVIAMQVHNKCIRVQWRREEEFGFEPVGTAHTARIRAVLDAKGEPVDWTCEVWAGSHVQRPVYGGNMLPHEALPDPPPAPKPNDPPEAAGGGGTRNAIPLYDIPAKRIIHHLALETPVRTSSLRGLGALPNVFALECFVDELAEKARIDPVAWRLAHVSDPRARALIENVAQRCGWADRGPGGDGTGMGIAWARYKNRAAYAAVAVQIEVERDIRVRRAWIAADAGLVINPDGATHQLEGGLIQAISMTLKEQVTFDATGIASLDWASYPILKFSEIPEISTEIVHRPRDPSLGMGECTFGPAAAAIGNALRHALGVRIREMPLTGERIAAALLRG